MGSSTFAGKRGSGATSFRRLVSGGKGLHGIVLRLIGPRKTYTSRAGLGHVPSIVSALPAMGTRLCWLQ